MVWCMSVILITIAESKCFSCTYMLHSILPESIIILHMTSPCKFVAAHSNYFFAAHYFATHYHITCCLTAHIAVYRVYILSTPYAIL